MKKSLSKALQRSLYEEVLGLSFLQFVRLIPQFSAKCIGKVTNISKKGEKQQRVFVLEMSGDFFLINVPITLGAAGQAQ